MSESLSNLESATQVNEEHKLVYRSIFISDVHLGTIGCQAPVLLDFLRRTKSEYLYLVGDIIDGWRLKQRWHWPNNHNLVFQKILKKARKGTKVTFIPGNHDEFARDYDGHVFGEIPVRNEMEHITLGGRKILILHGDQFDGVVRCAKWLAHFGSWAYDLTIVLNGWLNYFRRRMGLPYWSLSGHLKSRVKEAVKFITSFEDAVVHYAREEGAQAIVCGHIHHPAMREIDGILYLNDGDWVESCSALVEELDGTLSIIKWHVGEEPTVIASTKALA